MKIKKKKIKKPAKKAVKKSVKKTVKKAVKKAAPKKQKPIGVVTHYYGGIEVGIIKCAGVINAGANVQFKGATTDFTQTLDSMEYDRKPIAATKKGQEVGVKVKDRVREGDMVYAAE
ncbi:MAG: translation elongation factor-like protein [bacterium]|nr:translation elongation factor-like protein [bacterium]